MSLTFSESRHEINNINKYIAGSGRVIGDVKGIVIVLREIMDGLTEKVTFEQQYEEEKEKWRI